MKAYIIQNGHFSKAGNFIAFSALGERIHIYKKQINRLFLDRQVRFPFYCMAEHLTFDNTDGTTFTRLTASEISESTLGIVTYTMSDWVAEVKQIMSDEAADRISKELERAKKNYRRLENKYNELVTENNSLKQSLCDLDYKYDQLEKEHEALVAKVDHYGGNAGLKEENEKLKDYFKALQWENEHIQSERERLALIIMNASKVVASCDLGLSQEKINQLINNA